MNGAAVRPRWPAGVGVAVVLAALAFALALGGWTWRADRLVYDIGLSFWRRPVPEGIVIVAIDDASVAAIGRWPWPRAPRPRPSRPKKPLAPACAIPAPPRSGRIWA